MEKASKLATQAKDSLDKFVDTVKLKAHLATMDSKEAWQQFEKQLNTIRDDIGRFNDSIKEESDEARLQGHLALMDAKERWELLRADVDKLVNSMTSKTEESLDYAKLKMSLAKLEAKELGDKDANKKRFQKLGDEVKEDWYFFLSKMDERVVDFINRFPLR